MPDEKPAPQQKNNTLTIVLIVVGVIIILGIGGCVAAGFVAKKAAEGLVRNATGGVVNVNNDGSVKLSDGDTSINAGETASWPADMPSDVPKPTFGQVKMSSKIASEKAWNVVLENVSADQFKSYTALLKTKGWVSDAETEFVVSIAQFKKDDWALTVTHDPSSNGLSVNLMPQTK